MKGFLELIGRTLRCDRRIVLILVLLLFASAEAYAQGNTISGHVFGVQRTPIYDANVELLDEFSRTIGRTKTDSSGRYFFGGVPSGRLTVRVMALETDYEYQEQSTEIVNFTRETATGQLRVSGRSNEQLDFYLKPRKGSPLLAEAVFVQDIPPNAKNLYEKGIEELGNKKEQEGLADLKAAIEAFPKYYAALSRLGSEYVRLQHFQAARVLLALAVEVNPRGQRAWYGLAYALNSLDQLDDALVAAQKAVELYDKSAESLLLYGVLLRRKKQYDEAAKQMQRAIDSAGGSLATAHMQLALLYSNDMKRYRDAAKQLRLYLKAQPKATDVENIKKLITELEAKAKEQG